MSGRGAGAGAPAVPRRRAPAAQRRRAPAEQRRGASTNRATVAVLMLGAAAALAAGGTALASPGKQPHKNKPAPTFRFRPPMVITIPGSATRFAVGPLTRSRRPDIVTADNDGTVSVILNMGHGKFAKPVAYKVSPNHQVTDVAIADVNHDGIPDIVAVVDDGTGATTFGVLLGNGNGTFRTPIVSAGTVPKATYQNFAGSVAIGDLDGNGNMDAAVGFSPQVNTTDVVVYTGLGNGHFGGATAVLPISNFYGAVQYLIATPLKRHGPLALIATDSDCGYNSGVVAVFANNGHGGFKQTFSGLNCPSQPVVADLNGDGNADLFVTTGVFNVNGRKATIFYGSGNGTFPRKQVVNLGSNPTTVAAADLTENGRLDLIAGSAAGPLEIAAGEGDGRFGPPASFGDPAGSNQQIGTADLTGDGAQDIITVDGNITILFNKVLPRPAAALRNPRVSTIASSLVTPREAFTPIGSVVVNGSIVALLAMILTFPSQLFNQTFQNNYADIKRWWERRLRPVKRLWDRRKPEKQVPAAAPTSAAAPTPAATPASATPAPTPAAATAPAASTEHLGSQSWQVFVGVVLAGALLASLNDPNFGFHSSSLITYTAVLLAVLFGLAVPTGITAAYHRTHHTEAPRKLHAIPSGLAIGAACVLFSRATGFQPGYLYGVVAGVLFTKELARHEKGHIAALCTITLLVLGVAAWFAWVPVDAAAVKPGASTALVLLDDLLASIFVSGLVGTVIGLTPLRPLPGYAIKEWNRGVWVATYVLALFGLVQVLLRPHATGPSHTPIAMTVGLFVAFGVGSIAFHEHFEARRRATAGEPDPPLVSRLRALAESSKQVPSTTWTASASSASPTPASRPSSTP